MLYLALDLGYCTNDKDFYPHDNVLYLALDLGYCTKDEYEKLQKQLFSISSGIFKLIEYLKKV